MRTLLRKIWSGKFDRNARKALLRIPAVSFRIAHLLLSAYTGNRRPVGKNATVGLQIDCEQRRQPDSRIQLSTRRDSLGSRLAHVKRRISDNERYTIQCYSRILESVFLEEGLAEVTWLSGIPGHDDTSIDLATDSFHMMGGTRMGVNP